MGQVSVLKIMLHLRSPIYTAIQNVLWLFSNRVLRGKVFGTPTLYCPVIFCPDPDRTEKIVNLWPQLRADPIIFPQTGQHRNNLASTQN